MPSNAPPGADYDSRAPWFERDEDHEEPEQEYEEEELNEEELCQTGAGTV